MEFIKEITVELTGEMLFEYITAVQSDVGRKIKVILLANNQPYEIPAGATAVLRGKKPDGKAILNNCTIDENGAIIAELTKQTLAVCGNVRCQTTLYSSEGGELTSVPFVVKVTAKSANDTEVKSTNEFNVIAEAEALAQSAREIASEALENVSEVEARVEASTLAADEAAAAAIEAASDVNVVKEAAAAVTIEANEAAEAANLAKENADTATSNAEKATSAANTTKALADFCADRIDDVCVVPGKAERLEALDALQSDATEALKPQFADWSDEDFAYNMRIAYDDLVRDTTRRLILDKHYRADGRDIEDIRPLSAEVAVLPVVHGSALFSRGETQALVVATLGNEKDAQEADDLTGPGPGQVDRFYLHYNFPNYSVGEVGRIAGPGRREIGHGNLAERSVSKVIPKDFPYVVRCVSEIMSSNGSTSMASVCGATLALMDAGVPITAPVAGISCGLVTDDNGRALLLTDIIGSEDHFGDMDFKVCGTREGITGFQLDLKLPGISIDLLCEGMERDRVARLKILDVIENCIAAPRAEISERAPRVEALQINPAKIGALIGPGGKNIKAITEETCSTIDVDDDGNVKIMAANKELLEAAKQRVLACTAEAEIGKIYRGKVVSIRDFGAFVEILPGQEGLLHISEMANYRVNAVTDIVSENDFVTVKVIDIDNSGKIRLSRKAALAEMDK